MSAPSVNDSTKFFTHDWVITVSSHPNVKFYRCTPALADDYFPFISDPENHPFASESVKATMGWDEEKLKASKARMIAAYTASATKQNALTMLIQVNGEWVGYGMAQGYGSAVIGERVANIGLLFKADARGKGLGKLMLRLLLRLGSEMQVEEMSICTMKANLPMRAVAKRLGLAEIDHITSFPDFGVVGDLVYRGIKTEDWKDFDFDIEFLGSGPADFATEAEEALRLIGTSQIV